MPSTLAAKITSSLGLAEVVPVRREDDKVTPLASGYLPLQSLLRADGWILVPPDSEGYAPGSRVTVRPLP
jgi:molybdopterin biosynthesis enzyme